MSASDEDDDACVEKGKWTAVPGSKPTKVSDFVLAFSNVDPSEDEQIKTSGVMSFHMVGCAGDFSDHTSQQNVTNAMAMQVNTPGTAGTPNGPTTSASFFYHLGDVVYMDDDKTDPNRDNQKQMYNDQFYAPYSAYARSIFAIAGNHDGKIPKSGDSALKHFKRNFCAKERSLSRDNQTDQRPAMNQPYVYWRLDTPLAYIIGLYSNIANGGILDDPNDNHNPYQAPQFQWLVDQLRDVKAANESNGPRKAVLLAVHYPPYSGATNFTQRGDPTLGPSYERGNNKTPPLPLGDLLQKAFSKQWSGQRPDAVFSAHAHLYQRLTYSYQDGWEVPYLIAGCGGHSPIESMWKMCDGNKVQAQKPPFPAVMPPGLTLPPGDKVQVVAYNDLPQFNDQLQPFGFLRLTITSNKETGELSTLTGEFFTAAGGLPSLQDRSVLDLQTHQLQKSILR